MKILTIIVNFFAHARETEQANQQKWARWLYSDFITAEFKKRKVLLREQAIFRGKREIDSRTKKEIIFLDISSKSRVLRAKLDQIKNTKADSRHYSDFIIYIDGDGDIDFNVILEVFDVIAEKSKVCFLCRKGKYLMGEPRDSIERFENYLLENKYGIALPDGQCGCWGLQKEALDNGKDLIAEGFAIELNVLSMCLAQGIPPYFIPIALKIQKPSDASTFRSPEHKTKLNFIIEDLGLPTSFLHAIYKNFRVEYPSFSLPVEYLDLIEGMSGFPIERSLPKCHEKDNCDRCDISKL